VIAKLSAVSSQNPKDVRDVIAVIPYGATPTAILAANAPATTTVDPNQPIYKGFGIPSLSIGVFGYAFTATFKPLPGKVTAANDTAILYAVTPNNANKVVREGDTVTVPELPVSTYLSFSDPIVNDQSRIAFTATVKGTGISAANNHALIYGNPTGALHAIARTGNVAAKPQVDAGVTPEKDTKYASITAFALPGGANSGPIFVAKLSGAATGANNVGLFALSSDGTTVRRLLRTGDKLGLQTVKTITLLKTVPKDLGAARSFNSAGAVAVAIGFTDRTTALLAIGIP
jgi:hypothetical protein